MSLSYQELGEFEMTRLKISDFLSNSIRIEGGVLNGSSLTLEEIFIGFDEFGSIHESAFNPNYNKPRFTITTSAFSMLHKLRNITFGFLPNTFIESKAFADLQGVTEIKCAQYSIKRLETEAFINLPSLECLDLSYQKIEAIPRKAFSNMAKLKELFLGANTI